MKALADTATQEEEKEKADPGRPKKRFFRPRCPHCGKKVNVIRAWSLRREGEFLCPRCGGISNVIISPLVYLFAVPAVLIGGLVFVLNQMLYGGKISVWFGVLLILPFFLFYVGSAFLVRLKKPVFVKKRVPPPRRPPKKQESLPGRAAPPALEQKHEDPSHTIVMDPIRPGRNLK